MIGLRGLLLVVAWHDAGVWRICAVLLLSAGRPFSRAACTRLGIRRTSVLLLVVGHAFIKRKLGQFSV
jgi:hypothetical protein